MNRFRTASCAVAFFALAAASGVVAQDPTCGKNHYILTGSATPAWIATGNLSVPRSWHTATLLPDGKVLVAGGWSSSPPGALSSAELYDPGSGNWTTTGNLTIARADHTATLLPNGKVLVVGGGELGSDAAGTAELYDPVTGAWTSTGKLNTPRGGFTATLLDTGEVLVAGGADASDESLASAELYDPTAGTWTFTGDLLLPRFFHTATSLEDGRILIVGGWAEDFFQLSLATAELYDPAAGTWSSALSLAHPRSFHTATRLQDGTVLVAGGYQHNPVHRPGASGTFYVPTSLDQAELFDPITDTWEPVLGRHRARQDHTATLLRDGAVLIAGGYDYTGGGNRSSSESFVTATATWIDSGDLVSARNGHTATLLPDGTVLVVGGHVDGPGGAIALDAVELYEGGSGGCQ